jgi:hypothetical protein
VEERGVEVEMETRWDSFRSGRVRVRAGACGGVRGRACACGACGGVGCVRVRAGGGGGVGDLMVLCELRSEARSDDSIDGDVERHDARESEEEVLEVAIVEVVWQPRRARRIEAACSERAKGGAQQVDRLADGAHVRRDGGVEELIARDRSKDLAQANEHVPAWPRGRAEGW